MLVHIDEARELRGPFLALEVKDDGVVLYNTFCVTRRPSSSHRDYPISITPYTLYHHHRLQSQPRLFAMSKTWFLIPGPDFTLKPDGPLRLGTVIKHPKDPSQVLLQAASQEDPAIDLPAVETTQEASHQHSRCKEGSFGTNLFATLLTVASTSGNSDIETKSNIELGGVDQEVRQFSDTLSPACLAAIVANPIVRRHVDSGVFGKRPCYIVTSLRVNLQPMSVAKTYSYTSGGSFGGSGPAGTTPVEVGGNVYGKAGKEFVDTYEADSGIIFAYRVHMILQKKDDCVESSIFSSRVAFMSEGFGEDGDEVELEAVEVSPKVLEHDAEEDAEFENYEIDEYSSFVVF